MGAPTRLSIAAATAMLAACASSYQPESLVYHEGYSEQRRGPGAYEVWFKGSVETSFDQCEEFALLRAAELCLGDGLPFMKTSHFQTTNDPGHWIRSSRRELPRSALKVECVAERGADTKEAAMVAESIRKRYGIKAKSKP